MVYFHRNLKILFIYSLTALVLSCNGKTTLKAEVDKPDDTPSSEEFILENAQTISSNEFINLITARGSRNLELGLVLKKKTLVDNFIIETESGEVIKSCKLSLENDIILHSKDRNYLYQVEEEFGHLSGNVNCEISFPPEKLLVGKPLSSLSVPTKQEFEQTLSAVDELVLKKGMYRGEPHVSLSGKVQDQETGKINYIAVGFNLKYDMSVNPIYEYEDDGTTITNILTTIQGKVDPSNIEIGNLPIEYRDGNNLVNSKKSYFASKNTFMHKLKVVNKIKSSDFDLKKPRRIDIEEFIDIATQNPSRGVTLGTNISQVQTVDGLYVDTGDRVIGPCRLTMNTQQVFHSKNSKYLFQYESNYSTGSGAKGCDIFRGADRLVYARKLSELVSPDREELRSLLDMVLERKLQKGLYQRTTHLLVTGKSVDPETGGLFNVKLAFNPRLNWAINPIYSEYTDEESMISVKALRKLEAPVDPSKIDISDLPVIYDPELVLPSLNIKKFRN